MHNQSKLKVLAITIAVVVVAIIAGWILMKKKSVATPTTLVPQAQACTMDARQCPDGSYVGRTGPNCEFICPTAAGSQATSTEAVRALNPIPALMQAYTDASTKFTLKYKTFDVAVAALQKGTGSELVSPNKIDTSNGNPKFIFKSAMDQSKNDCLVGEMDLVTGKVQSHHDVCVSY